MFRVPERLYWTADRTRLVRHGDVEAAFLAWPAGEEIPDEEARRCGLLAGHEQKQRKAAPANKVGARPTDKTATPAGNEEDVTP